MAVTRRYRQVYECDAESERLLSMTDGLIYTRDSSKWWRVVSGAYVEQNLENPSASGYDGNPATITQDSTHRFTSDTEKSTWNAKVADNDSRLTDARTPTSHTHVATQVTEDATHRFTTDAEKSTWNAKQVAAVISRVTGSNATTTGQALTNVTGLSNALEANSVYEFEAVLSCSTTAVTTGTGYGVNFSAAGASIEAQIRGPLTTAADKSARINVLNSAAQAFLTTSAQTGGMVISGVITTGANLGNLTIQHLKVTSGTSTVFINSFLKTTKIA